MGIEIVTKEDLQAFRQQLLSDLKAMLSYKENPRKEWLRSSEVKKLLKISAGTLQNLRIAGKLKPVKVGGIFFYKSIEIDNLLKGDE